MTYVPVDEHGVVPPEAVRHALTDETILRSLMCLVHKLLHAPTVHWKRSSREGRARDDVQLVRHLFELDS
jgi:hypothetical protein